MNFMLIENSNLIYYAAMALILALLAVRTARKEGANSFRRLLPKALQKYRVNTDHLTVLAFKKCPQCDDQLPVSTLVCDACDYNFLASSILRHQLLPAPSESIASTPQQSFACHA